MSRSDIAKRLDKRRRGGTGFIRECRWGRLVDPHCSRLVVISDKLEYFSDDPSERKENRACIGHAISNPGCAKGDGRNGTNIGSSG